MSTTDEGSSSNRQENQNDLTATKQVLFSNLSGMTYAAILIFTYIVGFVTLNSYLLKFGISESEYTNPRVVTAAFSLILFLFCFYLFGGRAALFMPKWLKSDIDLIVGTKFIKLWSLLFFIFSFIHALFLCCLSSAFFYTIGIPHSHSLKFFSVLLGFFFATYSIDYFKMNTRFPKSANTIKTIIESIAIYAFFFLDNDQ